MFKQFATVLFLGLAAAGPATKPDAKPPAVPAGGGPIRQDAPPPSATTSDRVVLLCDASGSMLNKMKTLKKQLHLAVDGLKPSQSFNLIFFNEKVAALDDRRLLPATADNKKRADVFLDKVKATGTGDPVPGLTAAFASHPQLIYLLTDGDFPDNKAVLAKVKELNRDHKTKLNTIAFVGDADTDTEFLTVLRQIAKDNGGVFKHVAEKEMSK